MTLRETEKRSAELPVLCSKGAPKANAKYHEGGTCVGMINDRRTGEKIEMWECRDCGQKWRIE